MFKDESGILHHISVTTETLSWLRFLFSISFIKHENCPYLFSCSGTYLITQFYSRIVSKDTDRQHSRNLLSFKGKQTFS